MCNAIDAITLRDYVPTIQPVIQPHTIIFFRRRTQHPSSTQQAEENLLSQPHTVLHLNINDTTVSTKILKMVCKFSDIAKAPTGKNQETTVLYLPRSIHENDSSGP
jgi:hypothetical protein